MTDTTDGLYPEIEPYNTGRLRVSEIHELYFEEAGNPNGGLAVRVAGLFEVQLMDLGDAQAASVVGLDLGVEAVGRIGHEDRKSVVYGMSVGAGVSRSNCVA